MGKQNLSSRFREFKQRLRCCWDGRPMLYNSNSGGRSVFGKIRGGWVNGHEQKSVSW